MAHEKPHRAIKIWMPEEEAERLEKIADENERSLSAELRLACRNWLLLAEGKKVRA